MVRRVDFLLFFMSLLTGCASRASYIRGSDGADWVVITCSRDHTNCLERAGEECPGGYVVGENTGGWVQAMEAIDVAAAALQGGAAGWNGTTPPPYVPPVRYRGRMVIRCKDSPMVVSSSQRQQAEETSQPRVRDPQPAEAPPASDLTIPESYSQTHWGMTSTSVAAAYRGGDWSTGNSVGRMYTLPLVIDSEHRALVSFMFGSADALSEIFIGFVEYNPAIHRVERLTHEKANEVVSSVSATLDARYGSHTSAGLTGRVWIHGSDRIIVDEYKDTDSQFNDWIVSLAYMGPNYLH